MKYSYNQNRTNVVFAHMKDVNASFKDLGAVCTAIRYRTVPNAMEILDDTIYRGRPILYRRHNAHMGSRTELGGRKGRYPKKCAQIIKKVLVNAAANATNKGFEPEAMFVVHAAANKTMIARRGPSKGAIFVSGGTYGYMTSRRSDLEFAKVEIGISAMDDKVLGQAALSKMKMFQKAAQKRPKPKAEAPKKEAPKRSLITKLPAKEQPKPAALPEKDATHTAAPAKAMPPAPAPAPEHKKPEHAPKEEHKAKEEKVDK